MIDMCLCSVPALSEIRTQDNGVPPNLTAQKLQDRIMTSHKSFSHVPPMQKLHDKGKVKGNGKGEDDRITICFKSPSGEQEIMYAYGSETLENVRERLPMDPELGPYIKRDLCLMRKIPLGLTLNALNIEDGDTLYVNASGLCCERYFKA